MFSFDIKEHRFNHVHFIGIGGISMSGLAEILLMEGYKVSGSDMKNSLILNKLKTQGADIFLGHRAENINNANLVIYTDAISKDNPELLESKKRAIPTIDRGNFLGMIMKNYKHSIAVSGTHGKTTTTSMLSTIFKNSTLDPTILLGGELDDIGGNVLMGGKDLLLTEACEYKGNILKYRPTMAIILNMEEDHLDYFRNIDHIVNTFSEYAANIKKDGYLIINLDDKHSKKVINTSHCNIITFGINNQSDYVAENISYAQDGYPKFILNVKGKKHYTVELNVMGVHNIYNALASIAAASICNVPMEDIIHSIKEYRGTHRRLETKGYSNNIKIVDDYAHHPTEIKASLAALKRTKPKNLWCIFQPHTYSRTKLLLNEFSESFYDADKIIITDIYAAREKDTGIIHAKDLVALLQKKGVDAIYMSSFESIKNYLLENAVPEDLIVTMGAGNIYQIGDMLLEENRKKAI
ncbi:MULTISPECIES: UDP-N-acetylmuramate--L-alanine ligase [Tissierellales]|jgi:UDP-N-acetylmuramate--alanine ligase|uniref:UDP-N-acetylmuramate--L-alanine ligase n=1 Tax=Acidilutibacter cellobiosedens TaxID=2507161 RepID=A0A410QG18_9FIRM|nr:MULTISPECIES: UDP-N-acetylmuramate--L-alanine ligase [Tissierellales]MBE6082218.1 UDP-N-acetylmuramate--L-alanine ligase [Tissierellaceae bacterium]QAT62774.1 UDP-N-acetylmuramate--L-alanine ligase [Acidilutibacter cellobiosedens]SCL95480.1 UDP-N-acetylmuramate-L-alanine ligase [Sporanaerobacter sp. PP17-6a]